MASKHLISDDLLEWLLDKNNPDVRYLTLRDVLDRPANDPELAAARAVAHREGPIAAILAAMDPEGFWIKPGPGYSPKYYGTVWSIISLAQLGASAAHDERVARACGYVLDHALMPGGQFSTSPAPSGTADCLQGNLCAALLDLGCEDSRLDTAFEWMARTVTGEGIAPASDRTAKVRYYAGKCGPRFACGSNNGLPCAWGAVKVMLAFGKLPAARRTTQIDRAIGEGIDFLFSRDLVTADYPMGYAEKPNGSWWKFGFPVFYVTDLLQLAEALVALDCQRDHRLAGLLKLIRDKHDAQGRWPLEYSYKDKSWVEYGTKRHPNKWVTLRALKVLKKAA